MSSSSLGPTLVAVGAVIAAVGALIWVGGTGWLSWFGRLPGDIRIETDHGVFFFPIVTCLIISVVLSILIWFIRR